MLVPRHLGARNCNEEVSILGHLYTGFHTEGGGVCAELTRRGLELEWEGEGKRRGGRKGGREGRRGGEGGENDECKRRRVRGVRCKFSRSLVSFPDSSTQLYSHVAIYREPNSRYLTTPCDAKTLPFTWLRCLLDDDALAEYEGA